MNSQSPFDLRGKTALVTGASSGLGAHFAQVLAAQGAHVVLAARREQALAEQLAQIQASGGRGRTVQLDVSDPASIQAALHSVFETDSGPDILINNAGIAAAPTKAIDTSDKLWNTQLQTNLNGSWMLAREIAKRWIASGTAGSIVNVASVYGLRTGALKVAYNVSKAGVVQLSKSLAMEWARHDIRVNALCPGWFLTAINEDYFATEKGQRYLRGIPMQRMGQLHELDAPLLLLASEAGSYMTGATLCVDGGIAESPI